MDDKNTPVYPSVCKRQKELAKIMLVEANKLNLGLADIKEAYELCRLYTIRHSAFGDNLDDIWKDIN